MPASSGELAAGGRRPEARPPLASRLIAYLGERFPPGLVVVQALSYAAALLYGAATAAGGELALSAGDVAAVVAVPAFFVVARVFDEYKDYEFDVVHFPDRPLPRGAVSWRDVNLLAWAAVAVQVVTCVLLDGGVGNVCLWWAIAFAYLGLTRYEFFVRPWLRRHFVTNTVTHLPVYALASVWVAQIGARPEAIGLEVAWVAVYSYVFTFGMDFWRKSHAPEAEREGVDSYTQRFGVGGAAAGAAASVLAVSALGAVLLAEADAGSVAAHAALALVPLPLLAALARFARRPSAETNERARSLLALTLLAELVVVSVAIALERGLA